ncbi:protein Mpv17 isoform X2 [Orussus abietinus]|uniref:protein Mpv17 isoform X2 n=1 Tax=Orussus abietinus TaxID=222816 RepID=UPI000626D2DB|nr:protein Mpv17 isoform X2 [Orussus abietinus]
MSGIFRTYQRLLTKYPLRMQAVQTGILMATGDQIAQVFVERREYKDIDLVRTAQFGGLGFFLMGPAIRTWYGILDKRIGSKGKTVILKKVVCDQLFFAPALIAVLLNSIGFLRGNNLEQNKEKLRNEYKDILINNYKLWPMVQIVNFSLVPLEYQVLVVQIVAIFWNTYVSYRTHRDS